MKKTSWRSPILLFLTAVIWGTAFVAQSVGMDYVGGFTFNFVRNIIGGLVLLPCIFWMKRSRRSAEDQTGKSTARQQKSGMDKVLWMGGICCGAALFVASNLQQFGIKYTTVGKAGFITAMYIVIVPLMGIFLKRTVGIKVWISVLFSVAGLYLLCITDGFSLGFGDILVLICAVCFAGHILIIDHFSPKTDGVQLSCIQFFTCGILSGIGMLLFETPDLHSICQAWLPILYAGAMSSGVGYTLQIIGQKDMDPTVASLILSLESVMSVLAGWLILGQSLSMRELCGCVLMFVAIILAQLPERKTV